MSLNGLTGSAGLKLGPLVVETLVKHYFERLKASHKIPSATSSDGIAHDGALNDNLRKEELLYDQAFTIVKVSIVHVLSPDSPTALASRLAWVACPLPIVSGCVLSLPAADPRDLVPPSPRCGTQDFLSTSSR